MGVRGFDPLPMISFSHRVFFCVWMVLTCFDYHKRLFDPFWWCPFCGQVLLDESADQAAPWRNRIQSSYVPSWFVFSRWLLIFALISGLLGIIMIICWFLGFLSKSKRKTDRNIAYTYRCFRSLIDNVHWGHKKPTTRRSSCARQSTMEQLSDESDFTIEYTFAEVKRNEMVVCWDVLFGVQEIVTVLSWFALRANVQSAFFELLLADFLAQKVLPPDIVFSGGSACDRQGRSMVTFSNFWEDLGVFCMS